jgi:hypothetical protein
MTGRIDAGRCARTEAIYSGSKNLSALTGNCVNLDLWVSKGKFQSERHAAPTP